MATIKDASPSGVAIRLNWLEEVVSHFKTSTSRDSRLYNLTYAGSVIAAQDADWSKNLTVFEQAPSTSVAGTNFFRSVWGAMFGIGYWNIRTATRAFYDQLFGVQGNYRQYVDDDTPVAAALLVPSPA